jgi:hypothetical protein
MVFIGLNSFTGNIYQINKYLVLSNLATGLVFIWPKTDYKFVIISSHMYL